MLNITMEKTIVTKRSVECRVESLESVGSLELKVESFQITNSDRQEAIIVKNLTPKVPEKKRLLKKVISPTMGGWS